ncbi:alanine racemase [Xylanibacter ruminicola]|jgi:alanine racemase|uniref:Alanine racemase n=1 Tax=Xylanibacter ruminicola TaxID=839 RepID=A0A1H5RQZ5_XYLRU|nr:MULTISPECIES: bifunctional UDP-N-acetylmuramoyl-tripeptide:D-alanyl-D-alanine ligase/alanine racemase [Prevotellaceae]MCR5470087.1 bifunctional UDP-N-acetylmuramoyl-tripeptide:D-alanyl-D-alanine ligase/alanine racemase [Prevotella sp.]SEF40544.1 alanine racemase [Xylanibacter ruminicola]SEW10553.1 alanine racemase [Prevotella sp. khp7]
MKYSIEKVTTLIGARRIGEADAQIGWLLTDSRSLCFPEETLFFALRSARNDGHRYISDLYRRGVRNFVVEAKGILETQTDGLNGMKDANFLVVPSPLAALQRLAERHRDEFDLPIVGITGSNGKTMVKEWLYQLLLPSQKIVRSPRSYNSQIGVPLSVWLLNEQTEVGIFEAGISQPGEMYALRDIIQPTIGVLTSLGSAHQENFRSMEEKCMEKLELMHDTEAMVYCSDNDIVSRCIRRMNYKGEKIAWSMCDEQAAFFVKEVKDSKITYIWQEEENCYTIPFIDEASIENSITCAAVALYMGLTPSQIADRMAKLEPVAMRLEVKQGQRGCVIINDSYNSDINSLDIALDFMNRREAAKKTLILSDIFQTGSAPETLYAQVSELAVKRGIDKFIGIGPELMAQADKIQIADKAFFADVKHFLSSDAFAGLRDELVLLKGARSFCFDQITEQLEQKVHETILEVNLNAVVENLNYYRSFLKPETKMVCMIKADAYGAGAVEIAKTLQDHRVDYLAVAVADEGVALRKAGITANIMIMNPEMTAFKTMFDYDLEPEVYSFRLMDALIKAARKEGITGWPVHIKFDTGMHRLGFDPKDDIFKLIDRLKHQNAIIPRSVFSHFVGSDSDGFDEFSAQQFALFEEGSQRLQAAFGHRILRHMDNSAGIEHFPERQMDMCRLGLGLYGVDPRDNRILNTVSTLKTTILQLRHVPAGETVGYSRKGKIERDSVIAAIPIGYADGLNRHLGNRNCYCLVKGQKAEYVGNICMDVAMIDVTDIPCMEGDQVEIFGEHLPVTVLSDTLDTIPYEVLTGVSNRVKRVYFQD